MTGLHQTGLEYLRTAQKERIVRQAPCIDANRDSRRCVRMFSFVGDTILDPMCGSGTTCKMAKLLGRNYLGIDISKEYCKMARERVMQEALI